MSALSTALQIILVIGWIWIIGFFIIFPYMTCTSIVAKDSKVSTLQCISLMNTVQLMMFPGYYLIIFILIAGTVVPLIIPFFSANKQSNAPTNLQQSAGRRRH
jgi:uncharacterized membrane protein